MLEARVLQPLQAKCRQSKCQHREDVLPKMSCCLAKCWPAPLRREHGVGFGCPLRAPTRTSPPCCCWRTPLVMCTYRIVYSAIAKAALRRGSVLHIAAPGIWLLNCLRNSLLNVKGTHSLVTTWEWRKCLLIICMLFQDFFFLFYIVCNIGKAIFNLLSDICMQAELNAHKVTFIERILILQKKHAWKSTAEAKVDWTAIKPTHPCFYKQYFRQQRWKKFSLQLYTETF